jgi:hypothetical protein
VFLVTLISVLFGLSHGYIDFLKIDWIMKNSKAFGVVSDCYPAPSLVGGFGGSISGGLTVGFYKSFQDMSGLYCEYGGDVTLGLLSASVDFVAPLSNPTEIVGGFITMGVALSNGIVFGGHVRLAGNTFVWTWFGSGY